MSFAVDFAHHWDEEKQTLKSYWITMYELLNVLFQIRISLSQMLFQVDFLKIFANFTGKPLC